MRVIEICILAHNEEDNIGKTLKSLTRQSVVGRDAFLVRVYVVANGCTDGTVAAARSACSTIAVENMDVSVVELQEKGKGNAWNHYVHKLSAEDAVFSVMMDADVLIDDDYIETCMDTLSEAADVMIACGWPRKDWSGARRIQSWLIRRMEGSATKYQAFLQGAAYVARTSWLRQVCMPRGVVCEDSYLRAMTLTDCFRIPEDCSRIINLQSVCHEYRPYDSFYNVFKYERRQLVGTVINSFIYEEVVKRIKGGGDAFGYVSGNNASDPEWLEGLIAERYRESVFNVKRAYLFRRARFFRGMTARKVLLTPVALAAIAFDMVVAVSGTLMLMRRGGRRWETIRKTG